MNTNKPRKKRAMNKSPASSIWLQMKPLDLIALATVASPTVFHHPDLIVFFSSSRVRFLPISAFIVRFLKHMPPRKEIFDLSKLELMKKADKKKN